MNFRRIIGTLIVLLATIVGRWIAREPASTRPSKRSSQPTSLGPASTSLVPEAAPNAPIASSLTGTPAPPVVESSAASATPPTEPRARSVELATERLEPPDDATPRQADVIRAPAFETAALETAAVRTATESHDVANGAPVYPGEPVGVVAAATIHDDAAASGAASSAALAELPRGTIDAPVSISKPSASDDVEVEAAGPDTAFRFAGAPGPTEAADDDGPRSTATDARRSDGESPRSPFEAFSPLAATRPRDDAPDSPNELPHASDEMPSAIDGLDANVEAFGRRSHAATGLPPHGSGEEPVPAGAVATVPSFPRAWSRDWPIAVPARPNPVALFVANAFDDDASVATAIADDPSEIRPRPERPLESDTAEAGHSEATEREAASVASPDDDRSATASTPAPRSRRRSVANDRPSRLLGGAGFLIVAIVCFVGSFVLFVRLTTPDRAPASVYTVVSYVAAADRGVPPAVASFAGDVDAGGELWLVMRLPVAARYVALTGLRTIDRWTSSDTFALAGPKATFEPNAASCYSGAGVANGPPELTPLPSGLVVREPATSTLSPERLVRVDVGALFPDATGRKTLVCAIVSPARTGFATYAATIGAPNVAAYEATGSQVKLSVLPLAVDFSTFGNAAAMRFTQTSLSVATDPMHATLDVAGFATFAYDDADGNARRDVLLFITGALATLGAVATIDALRPWLGIERR